MSTYINSITETRRRKTYLQVAIWTAAALVGIAAVLYAKLIAWSQELYFDFFRRQPMVLSIATPIFFLISAWLVQKFAQEAKGSGPIFGEQKSLYFGSRIA